MGSSQKTGGKEGHLSMIPGWCGHPALAWVWVCNSSICRQNSCFTTGTWRWSAATARQAQNLSTSGHLVLYETKFVCFGEETGDCPFARTCQTPGKCNCCWSRPVNTGKRHLHWKRGRVPNCAQNPALVQAEFTAMGEDRKAPGSISKQGELVGFLWGKSRVLGKLHHYIRLEMLYNFGKMLWIQGLL